MVVVTGDNQATAEAVCRSIGALGADAGLDSQQLSSLTGVLVCTEGWCAAQVHRNENRVHRPAMLLMMRCNAVLLAGKSHSQAAHLACVTYTHIHMHTVSLLAPRLVAHTLIGACTNLVPACWSIAAAGAEFDALSAEQQASASKSLAVFARVEPLHKLRLVELLRDQVRVSGGGTGGGGGASCSSRVTCWHCKKPPSPAFLDL